MKIFSALPPVAGALALLGGVFGSAPSAGAAELTFDVSHYAYRETVGGAFFMKDVSSPVFYSLGLRNWDRPPADGHFGFMYTGELTYGRTDYSSAGSGTMNKDYYKGRVEAYLAYRCNAAISPFIGLGYRQLFDNSGGQTTSTGALGYDRMSQYLYLPIGARFDPFSRLSIKAQYDLFLGGRQTSYLSTASSSYSDITNRQRSGWGLDLTANYRVAAKWSLYSFFRYWDIKKSDTATGTYSGVSYLAYEPDNTTQELGVGVAYRF